MYHLNLTILPCHTPAAVEVEVEQADGTLLLDDVLTRSRLENVTFGGAIVFQLNVTIQHEDDAIILKVSADVSERVGIQVEAFFLCVDDCPT